MAEAESEVDELLKQLRGAKQRELRLRAEKERVRLEIGQLRGDPLWAREQQARKVLEGVRCAKEQLLTQQQQETESLERLNRTLQAKEMDWRRGPPTKADSNPRVQPSRMRGDDRRDSTHQPSRHTAGSSSARDSMIEPDALQSLMRKIDSAEQQRRVARLQTELHKANARREADDLLEGSFETTAILPITRAKSESSARICEQITDESNSVGVSSKLIARSSGVKSGRNTPQPEALKTSGEMSTSHTQHPTTHYMASQPLLQSPPWPISLPSMHIAPTYPYSISSHPAGLAGFCNPVGLFPYQHSAFQHMQQYHAPIPLQWPALQDVYTVCNVANPVGVLNPFVSLTGSVQPGQERAAILQLERQIEVLKSRLGSCSNDDEVTQLQHRVSQLTRKLTELTYDSATKAIDTPDTANEQEVSIGDDQKLISLKREHLEAITKLRNERDLLEEREKLDEFKEDISRRRIEKKREQDHTDWIARQKRELVELRLQRSRGHKYSGSTRSPPDTETDIDIPQSYSPEVGLTLFWDDIVGVPVASGNLQITYAVFEGTLLRTSFRAIPAKDVEVIGPTSKRFIFRGSRHLAKLIPNRDMRVLMEVSAVPEVQATRSETLSSFGWSVMELFITESEIRDPMLASGFFKLLIRKPPMPDPSKAFALDLPSIDEGGVPYMRMRVAFGNKADDEALLEVDPQQNADRYKLPSSIKNVKPTSLDSTDRRGSAQCPEAAVDNPMRQSNDQGAHSIDRSNNQRRPSVVNIQPTKDRLPVGSINISKDPVQIVEAPWIRVDKRSETKNSTTANELFEAGSGFDVAIDCARCLPDNATITKVTVAALNSDRSQVDTTDGIGFSIPTSSIFDPVFDMYIEYRQPSFNPTLTLIIRVDTVDLSSKLPVILGYCVLPVFLDVDTCNQPSKPVGERVWLNEGGFQLPLHTDVNFGALNQQLTAKKFEPFPAVPCATLLLRLIRAKKSADGVTLSRKTFPPDQWESKGLLNLAPRYENKVYDSMGCIPTQIEQQIYELRSAQRKPRLVSECYQHLDSLSVPDVNALLRTKPNAFLDLKYGFKYQPTIGFRISVDGLHNVKSKSGLFFKVLCGAFPPGAFYQTPRSTSGISFTAMTNWDSAQTSPEFKEEWMTMRNHSSQTQPLLLLFDVRTITRDSKTGEISIQNLGWTFAPILSDWPLIAIGSMQLPLFQGEVQIDILQSVDTVVSMAAMMEMIGRGGKGVPVTLLDGASLFVRLEDPQVPSISTQPMTGTIPSPMLPKKQATKYMYDPAKIAALRKKAPMSKLLPPNSTAEEFEKEINRAFVKEMGLQGSTL